MNTSSFLALRNFGGVPEITPNAHELKKQALALAKPIQKVESESDQTLAVTALRELKAIRTGIEATRKSVKAPVIELGKQIDQIAWDFVEEANREEMRLQGLVNHYQRKVLEAQREEIAKRQREAAEAERLEAEAKKKREEAERANDPALKVEASKLEEKALDATMAGELTGATLAAPKPKGLVVQTKLNFEIRDAIIFCQAYPQFFAWNAETETLKLCRRDVLEELNRADGKGIFHVAQFPDELPASGSRLAKPPGMTMFEETKSHVR